MMDENSAVQYGKLKETRMNRLSEFRVKKLLTQSKLAQKVGLSQVTICLIEKGRVSPFLLTKYKIAKFFKVEVEDIFPEENSKK